MSATKPVCSYTRPFLARNRLGRRKFRVLSLTISKLPNMKPPTIELHVMRSGVSSPSSEGEMTSHTPQIAVDQLTS